MRIYEKINFQHFAFVNIAKSVFVKFLGTFLQFNYSCNCIVCRKKHFPYQKIIFWMVDSIVVFVDFILVLKFPFSAAVFNCYPFVVDRNTKRKYIYLLMALSRVQRHLLFKYIYKYISFSYIKISFMKICFIFLFMFFVILRSFKMPSFFQIKTHKIKNTFLFNAIY